MSQFRNLVENTLEKIVLTENPNTNLKAALIGVNPNVESLTLITAENPLRQKNTYKDNKEALDNFKAQLKAGGHPYQKVNGKYRNNERSFVIFNLSRSDAESYARVYRQESFIFGIKKVDSNNKPYIDYEYWETKDEGKTYNLVTKATRINNVQDLDNYFTRLHDYKFSIDFNFDEALEESILNKLSLIESEEDKQWLKEYVNGNRVGMSSYLHYKNLYKS